jgi:hypothetical protein
VTVVVVLAFGGRDQSDLAVQSSVVEPVEVLGDGDLEVVEVLPRPLLRTSSALNSELKASARALS